MELESFENCCRMAKVRTIEKITRFNETINKQKDLDDMCYSPKSKFVLRRMGWVKICPVCKTELTKEIVSEEALRDGTILKMLYTCGCGYKYAEEGW